MAKSEQQPLSKNELITDRHIESTSEDLLRHEPVANQIAQLISTVGTPCSIAIYGPWGSGKSGLARLIEADLAKLAPRSKLVIFDASKYAGVSLRRHFVSQVAKRLGVGDDEFQRGLYTETNDTTLTVPPSKIWQTLRLFLYALAAAAAFSLVLALVVAGVADGPTGRNFNTFAKYAFGFATAPAAIIAAFLALAGKTIPVDRKRSAPSSEEEFERLFRLVLSQSDGNPVVVFVDELDRCAPKDVVATLETIRTFLGIRKCVFLVAADQQVLEQALQDASGQANPANQQNPYYSAGSEYLDKTFQHQVHLPPLLPQRLTQFAIDLTDGLDGMWKEIDRDEILSVLIPTHVHSPRRVKALLNSYVMAYRITGTRLDKFTPSRAAELAKLVCLRCEFPLFASDLEVDANLPEYVLSTYRAITASTDEAPVSADIPTYLSEEVRKLAAAYATSTARVDEVLVKAADEREQVARAQSAQFLAYLQKTEHVGRIKRDLVHLEATGEVAGLDEALAESIENYAVNGQREEILALLRDIGNETVQLALVRHLAHTARFASHGIESRNSISALLAAISALPDLDLSSAAIEIRSSVAGEMGDYRLEPHDLPGAFGLATRTPGASTSELVGGILERQELLSDSDLGATVLAHLSTCLPAHLPRIVELIVVAVTRGDDVIEDLLALPDPPLLQLIDELRVALPAHVALVAEETSQEPTEGSEEDPTEGQAAAATAQEFAERLSQELQSAGRRPVAERALTMLLELATGEAPESALVMIGRLAELKDPELVAAVLETTARTAVSDWPTWLAGLNMAGVEAAGAAVGRESLAKELWRRAIRDPNALAPDKLSIGLAEVSRLGYVGDESLATVVAAAIHPPTSESAAVVLQRVTHAAILFSEAKTLDPAAWLPHTVDALEDAFRTDVGLQPSGGVLPAAILDCVQETAATMSTAEVGRLFEALADASWIPSPEHDALLLVLAEVSSVAGVVLPSPCTWDELASLAVNHPAIITPRVGGWLRTYPDPAELRDFFVTSSVTVETEWLADLKTRAHSDPAWAEQSITNLLDTKPDKPPDASLLHALGSQSLHAQVVADFLVGRFSSALSGTIPDREAVLKGWESADPEEAAARRRLVEELLMPMIEKGKKGDLEVVLRNLGLAAPAPYGFAEKLPAALRAAAQRHGLVDDTQRRMERHGLVKPKKKATRGPFDFLRG